MAFVNRVTRPLHPALPAWAAGVFAWFLGASCLAAQTEDLTAYTLDKLLDLEVSGASKFALRVSESASSATVISAEEIRTLGYRTLAEALQSVRGLVTSSDRTYSYLGVRGYAGSGDYNTRILVLIDGNRVNDSVYEQGFIGSEFPLDMDLVERIEFIPGQGSAVHGGNALFGVVNVVTRSAASQTGSEVAVAAGSGHLRELRASTSQRVGNTGHVLISALKRRVGGSDVYYAALDTPQTNNGHSVETDHERAGQLYLKYEQGGFNTTLVHGERARGNSASPGTVFGDTRNASSDTVTLADATLAHRIDGRNLWKLRAYAGSYSFRGDFVVDYPPVTVNRDRAESRWWGVETNWYTEQVANHKLVVGVDLQSSPKGDQSNADVGTTDVYLDDHRSSHRQSVFAEDQWALSQVVSLSAGLRYDRVDADDVSTQFSPRLALVARPSEELVLKLIHGTGFRAPNAYEANYAVAGSIGYKGNTALHDEHVRGTEAVVEFRPDAATRWTLSSYETRATHLLVQAIDPADNQLVFNNVGSLRLRGVELEAEHIWTTGVHLRGSYSLQKAQDDSAQNLANRTAARLGKLVAIVPIGSAWTIGLQTLLVSRRGNEIPGYGLSNLTVSRAWAGERARVSFSVHDVFDRRGDDPGSDSVLQPVSPQDGRSARATFEWKF